MLLTRTKEPRGQQSDCCGEITEITYSHWAQHFNILLGDEREKKEKRKCSIKVTHLNFTDAHVINQWAQNINA